MERSRDLYSSARIFVTYGPTEAAVDTTTFEAVETTTSFRSSRLVSIGHPDAFRILDLCGPDDPSMAVPMLGTVGELRIAGCGLAHGYLGSRNVQAFTVAPRAAGKRYASGDAVRWTTDGLEFLGRLDSQAIFASLPKLLEDVALRLQNVRLG